MDGKCLPTFLFYSSICINLNSQLISFLLMRYKQRMSDPIM